MGGPYKHYSVYDRDTDMPILIHATSREVCERLDITCSSFYSYVSHTRSGARNNKYQIYLDEEGANGDG